MSGGYFEYKQFYLNDIREQLQKLIDKKDGAIAWLTEEKQKFFRQRLATIAAQLHVVEHELNEMDLFLSGDTDFETFLHKSLQSKDFTNP